MLYKLLTALVAGYAASTNPTDTRFDGMTVYHTSKAGGYPKEGVIVDAVCAGSTCIYSPSGFIADTNLYYVGMDIHGENKYARSAPTLVSLDETIGVEIAYPELGDSRTHKGSIERNITCSQTNERDKDDPISLSNSLELVSSITNWVLGVARYLNNPNIHVIACEVTPEEVTVSGAADTSDAQEL